MKPATVRLYDVRFGPLEGTFRYTRENAKSIVSIQANCNVEVVDVALCWADSFGFVQIGKVSIERVPQDNPGAVQPITAHIALRSLLAAFRTCIGHKPFHDFERDNDAVIIASQVLREASYSVHPEERFYAPDAQDFETEDDYVRALDAYNARQERLANEPDPADCAGDEDEPVDHAYTNQDREDAGLVRHE